ncbi:hypothetical protein [Cohnella faecalis]|uniref:hypothetical protein n=1 Tax=Cohnella faecalis TaxID=2315694 RepID=UPI001314C343|nr:hypothetical protein [Cohnella faecalis]
MQDMRPDRIGCHRAASFRITNTSINKTNNTATEVDHAMDAALFGWLAGSVGAAVSSAGAAVYGLTVKAQSPRLVPNERQPEVPFESVEWKSGEGTVRGWFVPHSQSGSGSSGSRRLSSCLTAGGPTDRECFATFIRFTAKGIPYWCTMFGATETAIR